MKRGDGMDDLFDPRVGEAIKARDEALERVWNNTPEAWRRLAFTMVAGLVGWSGTAEQLRLLLRRTGLPKPHHHNAWGSLVKRLLEKGYLFPTGKSEHMATRRSHGRKTPVYRTRDG